MEALGFSPIPVFHGGEPWEYYQRYLNSHPYVCLGGMVGVSGHRSLMRWLVRCFQMAKENGTRIHGFGQTSLSILRALPFYSFDSSSWAAGHRWGHVQTWDGYRFRSVQLGNFKEAYEQAPELRKRGADPALIARRLAGQVVTARRTGGPVETAQRERRQAVTVSARAWADMELWLQEHHGRISPPEGYEGAGPKLYYASAGNPDFYKLVVAALDPTDG